MPVALTSFNFISRSITSNAPVFVADKFFAALTSSSTTVLASASSSDEFLPKNLP